MVLEKANNALRFVIRFLCESEMSMTNRHIQHWQLKYEHERVPFLSLWKIGLIFKIHCHPYKTWMVEHRNKKSALNTATTKHCECPRFVSGILHWTKFYPGLDVTPTVNGSSPIYWNLVGISTMSQREHILCKACSSATLWLCERAEKRKNGQPIRIFYSFWIQK